MRPIPLELRERLASKKYYKRCALCHAEGVQWHHNLIYAGRQVNAEFCIIPLCPSCHAQARNKEVKEKLDWIMLNRADNEELLPYCKAVDYIQLREKLNAHFGKRYTVSDL